MYSLEKLYQQMNQYKIDSTSIKPISFIFKSEEQIFSDLEKENEYKKMKDSVFISIIKTYPKIRILIECCVSRDTQGGIITHRNNLYRPGQYGLYQWSKETINIIKNFNKGYRLIEDINKILIEKNIEELKEIKNYISK